MSTQPKPSLTPAEYLAIERGAEYKSEYYAGEMFAMAGASWEHNQIVANLVRTLGNVLDGSPCQAVPSDMRVKVEETGLYTYPDVVVVCEEPQFEDKVFDTLLNPTVLVEVLSESTEKYDRGKKTGHYRRLESLREYLLVAQDEPRVEHYTRRDDGDWVLSDAIGLEAVVKLAAAGAGLTLAEIYARVQFPEPGTPAAVS